ncbi:hypothetical protein AB1N83_012559 [Pleurotus pulmonarius]
MESLKEHCDTQVHALQALVRSDCLIAWGQPKAEPTGSEEKLSEGIPMEAPSTYANAFLRLLYKTDGTPRSKFTGLAIASLATLSFLLYEALAVIDELDHSAHLLAALLHVQRADYRLFAATNLADPVHLLRLYRALQAPDSDSDAGEKVYSYEKLRAILRETCEGVHDILHDPLEEAHELAAASKIVDLLDASFGEVLRILEHQHQHQHRHEQKREGVARAEEHPRGEEYEVVG